MSGRRRGNQKISGQWSPRLIEMLEAPAYRTLSLAAHRVLARIEIEYARHGGNSMTNGNLIVTFKDFEAYGIDRHAIAPAIRELEALGFIEVTQKGTAGTAGYRRANKFRLTYRPFMTKPGDGTHEWRRFKTIEEAEAVAKRARAEAPEPYRPRRAPPQRPAPKEPGGQSPMH
jgi:hypothetical protein